MGTGLENTQELPIWFSPEREETILNILIVEDEKDIREFLKMQLEGSSFAKQIGLIETAVNGQEAIELIKTNKGKFNVVITDGKMPRMDGLELAEKIKESGEKIVVGLVSAAINGYDLSDPYTQKELEEKYGVTAVSAKPLEPNQLPEFMQKLIDRVRAQQAKAFHL